MQWLILQHLELDCLGCCFLWVFFFFFLVIFLFFNFLFCIGVQLIDNVVLVSGVQQSDSVIHIHVSILFHILFSIRLLQNTEQSSLCYTVGPCWLSILHIAVYTCPGSAISQFCSGTSDKLLSLAVTQFLGI